MGLSPGTTVLLGVLVLLYGVLIGGTWVRRHENGKWDTIATIIFVVIAGLATTQLIIIGGRQANYNEKARDRLNCIAEQMEAVRVQAPLPNCQVKW